MTMMYIYVDKGDIVGLTSRGKPYRDFVVSYQKVNKSSDLGLGRTNYMSSGAKTGMIDEARKLARKFKKEGYSSILYIHGCGSPNNGTFRVGDDGRFYRS